MLIKFILSLLPAALIIFCLIIGFCLGFTNYAVMLKIAVRKGRAFAIDRNGTWQPYDPREYSEARYIISKRGSPWPIKK